MKREQPNGKTKQEAKTMDTGRLAILDTISLKRGSHRSFEDGACVMEAAAYIAGEPHSDHPACVSDVIGTLMRAWNDSLRTDEDRDRLLKPLVLTIIGTRSTAEDDQVRSWMAMDWLVREHLPTWLELAGGGLEALAAALRALPEITNAAARSKAQLLLGAIRPAALAAAWDAAWDAAGAAAGAAAWDAAWDAARAVAGPAVKDTAWAAAWDAAWNAARDAARAAAWAVPGEQLAATVARLQASAVALVERMAAVGRVPVTEAS